MSPSALRDIFGVIAPWVATALLVLLAGVFTAAFAQGREVTFWPPRIGPRPQRTPSPNAAAQPTDVDPELALPVPRQPARTLTSLYDQEFDAHHARDFYHEVASVYDTRNSGNLVSTHLATISRIQAMRATRSTLQVLDLGGGTGNPIATHFFNDRNVEWTYVDFCPAVETIFRRNLAGYLLERKVTIQRGDLTQVCRQLRQHRYDVVLLSLVLTSMPTLPDFADIARLVTPGGSLIITDISPAYTKIKPYYEVAVSGRLLALQMVPVDPLQVVRRVTAAGLTTTEITPLGDDDPYYSWVATFTATPIPHQDENHGDDALASR